MTAGRSSYATGFQHTELGQDREHERSSATSRALTEALFITPSALSVLIRRSTMPFCAGLCCVMNDCRSPQPYQRDEEGRVFGQFSFKPLIFMPYPSLRVVGADASRGA